MKKHHSCRYAETVLIRMESDCDDVNLGEDEVRQIAKQVLDITSTASNGGFQTVYCGIWEPELDFDSVPKLFEDVNAPFYAELVRKANALIPARLRANSVERMEWLEANEDKLQEVAEVFHPAAMHTLVFNQAMVLYALKHPKNFPSAIQFIHEHLDNQDW